MNPDEYRIAPNWQPVQNFVKFHRGRPCKEKCNACETRWHESGTFYVHLCTRIVQPDLGKQFYICDDCLEMMAN